MSYLLIGLLILAVLSAVQILRVFITWEIRWEMRLIRLAFHAALFGAGVTLLGLLWAGWLKL